MGKVIAISNQKGGVGKTTTVVNLAAYAALGHLKTLVIDSDPQGNASSVLAHQNLSEESVYKNTKPIKTVHDRLWIIPSAPELVDQEKILTHSSDGYFALKRLLEPLKSQFDLILIDCPPSLARLSTNALLASEGLLIPLQSEYFALEGLSQLLAYVEELEQEVNADIELIGILLTMFDGNQPLASQVEREVRTHFADQVFKSVIPRDVALAASPSHGKTILDYDPLSNGGMAYLAAAKELLHVIKR